LPLISEVVKESHEHGIRVVAHATELETARVAVEAGADILAHSIRDREVNKSFIDLLLSKGIIYIPTLMVGMRYEEVMSQQIELSAPERKIANPRILESLNDLQNIPERLIPPGVLGKMKRKASVSPDPIAMKNLEILKRAGVTIALGTDAGNIGTVHGPAVFREMELMEEGGMSAEEILTSATMNGAKLLGKEKELGTLETGKLADLVILSSNPLAAPGNMSDIHLVMKGGRIIGP
jgi:imidazolonepropionase-like amidohydrolase